MVGLRPLRGHRIDNGAVGWKVNDRFDREQHGSSESGAVLGIHYNLSSPFTSTSTTGLR